MKTTRTLFASLVLSLLISVSTFAGEIPTPGATGCPEGQQCLVSGSSSSSTSDGDIAGPGLTVPEQNQETFVADPVVGTLLVLFGLF